MNPKNICLIGFSHDAEDQIRSLFAKYLEKNSVAFVYASDRKLDGAVINASLLDAPQIQKYVQTVRYPIVCVCPNYDSEKKAARYRLHGIRNTEASSTIIKKWLSLLLGEEYLKQDDSRLKVVYDESKPRSADNPEIILRAIKQGKNTVYRAQSGESITWVKPAQDVVFINYARDQVPGYENWEWIEVTEDDIPFYARKLKLDLWLFETLWRSNIDGSLYINMNSTFRLLHWPQPLGRTGRTEALRLAACAQEMVDIRVFQQKTNYPVDKIARFLFATTMAGQVEENNSHIPVQQTHAKPKARIDEGQKKEKLSLLQRLRAKLGL